MTGCDEAPSQEAAPRQCEPCRRASLLLDLSSTARDSIARDRTQAERRPISIISVRSPMKMEMLVRIAMIEA